MILNKKEWEQIDKVGALFLHQNIFNAMTEKEKQTVNEFMAFLARETERQKIRNKQTSARIMERRKIDKNYARPKRTTPARKYVRRLGVSNKEEQQ